MIYLNRVSYFINYMTDEPNMDFQNLFEYIQHPIYISDPNTYEILYANEAIQNEYEENILGKLCYKVLQDQDSPCPFCTNDKLFGNPSISPYVWEFYNKKVNKWFLCTDQVIERGEKKLRYELAVDITAHKKREQELKDTENRYLLFLENANDMISVNNKKSIIEYHNADIHEEILGYTKEEINGKSFVDKIHIDDIGNIITLARELNENGEGATEVRFKRKDGEYIWLEMRGKAFVDLDGEEKTFLISRNINKRKNAEQMLITSEKKYRKAYNLANFLKDVILHDLSNVLQTIISSIKFFSRFKDNPEELDILGGDISEVIEKHANRGMKLIRNILMLSRLEDEQLAVGPTDLRSNLIGAIEHVHSSMLNDKKIDIKTEGLKGEISVLANELLIDLFENLLNNAVKYNENDIVKIIIKISRLKNKGLPCIKMEFSDNAKGIPDEHKELIFEKGHIETKGGKGLGFGLSVVRKMLGHFLGEIWVEDNVEGDYSKGSNFVILIPESK